VPGSERAAFLEMLDEPTRREVTARSPTPRTLPVVRIAVRDHARVVAIAQNPANAGAFKTKPRELRRGAPVNCAATFGWWWKEYGSA
jgi:hypothetical protein